MARYSYAPRQGHLKTALQNFGYLKHQYKEAIRFNTDVPDTLEEEKLNKGWKDLYPFAEEKNTIDKSEPKKMD